MPRLNRLRIARARPSSGGGPIAALLAKTLPPTVALTGVRSLVPSDAGDPVHFVGFTYQGVDGWSLGITEDETGDGLFFRHTNGNRLTLYRGRHTDASNTWVVASNQINNLVWTPPASGADLQARANDDGSVGLYVDNALSVLGAVGSGIAPGMKGNYVSFVHPSGAMPTGLRYGGSPSPLIITGTRYDAYTRAVDVDVTYTNLDTSGTIPTTPQIDYGDGTKRAMTVVANPIPGKATLRHVAPKSIDGYKQGTIRFGNQPANNQPVAADIRLPFNGRLGGNGDNGSLDPYLFYWLTIRDGANGGNRIAGLTEYPGSFIPGTTDGVGGVKRTLDGQVGGNDQGITSYVIRSEFFTTIEDVGEYTLQFLPGLDVQSVFTTGFGWSYDRPSGFGKFVVTANNIGKWTPELRIIVSSIPNGATVELARPKLSSNLFAQYNQKYVDFQKAVSNGSRPLDTSLAVNNKNVNNRTYTTMAVATPENQGMYSIDHEIAEVITTGNKHCVAMNTHIDSVEMVTLRAQQYANRLPLDVDVYMQTSNEAVWNNTTFTHALDLRLEGLRQGFHLVSTAADARTTKTIIQTESRYLPAVFSNYNNPTEEFTFAQPMASGVTFFCSVNGGYFTFTTKRAIAAGEVVKYGLAKYGDNSDTLLLYADNGAAGLAGGRYFSYLVKRNLGIWRSVFAAAGRPEVIGMVDGPAIAFNGADAWLAWDNLRQYLAQTTDLARRGKVTIAPYFNNGIGGYNMMNYNEARIWDATAKALISASDYAGAAAYITPKAIDLLSLMRTHMDGYRAYLYSKNVEVGLAPDAVRMHFYEIGDHSTYTPFTSWPSTGIATAFYNTWVGTSAYCDFLKAYYKLIGNYGAEGFTYHTHIGPRSFGLGATYADTSLTGSNINQAYKAIKETLDDVKAAVAAA